MVSIRELGRGLHGPPHGKPSAVSLTSVRATLLLLPLLLSGCNVFDFLSPTAVEGIFVGVEVANGETTLGDGPVLGAAFLANATSIHDFSANLVTDPDQILIRTQGDTASLEAEGDGLFVQFVRKRSSW